MRWTHRPRAAIGPATRHPPPRHRGHRLGGLCSPAGSSPCTEGAPRPRRCSWPASSGSRRRPALIRSPASPRRRADLDCCAWFLPPTEAEREAYDVDQSQTIIRSTAVRACLARDVHLVPAGGRVAGGGAHPYRGLGAPARACTEEGIPGSRAARSIVEDIRTPAQLAGSETT